MKIKTLINKIILQEMKNLKEAGHDHSTSAYYDTRTGKSKSSGNQRNDLIVKAIENISNRKHDDKILNQLIKIIPSKYDVYDSWPESLWIKVEKFLKSKGEL